jgi:hypothetical protein
VKSRFFCMLLGFAVFALAPPLAAQQVKVASTVVDVVWQYSFPGTACVENDYSDVPVRPFLVGLMGQTVLWFAANSNGSYASVGVSGSTDILARLQRGTAAGPGCVSWLPSAKYVNSTPASYNTGLWMVAPFTPDGKNIQALVHNEFHGEWVGLGTGWCWQQVPEIYLPCDYWNIVSAQSNDGGQSFSLRQNVTNTNAPAIALGAPYQPPMLPPPPQKMQPTNLPQGITAQSNILQVGRYYYVLVQQLPFQPQGTSPSAESGVCIYRAPVPIVPGASLTWMGWGGSGYTVPVPTSYPVTPTTLCQPMLDAPFRFSWSFNTVLNQYVIIGQDTLTTMAKKNVSTDGCPYAPGALPQTADEAFVYMTAALDGETGQLSMVMPETCLLQINSVAAWQNMNNQILSGQAYPSLLDPTSPQLRRGDRNFQYSGAQPYLYFTQLNPLGMGNYHGNDRGILRVPLAVSATQ